MDNRLEPVTITDATGHSRVYEGAALEHAVRRARRWLRNQAWTPASPRPPRHIRDLLQAFWTADLEGYRNALAAREAGR